MKTTRSGARNQEGCPTSPYPVYGDGGSGCRHRERPQREEQQLVRDLERACEPQQQLAQGAEMTTLDLAEMMEQQMTGEDATEIAFSLGMPRV